MTEGRYCNGMRFVGKPGNMWTECTKPGNKYRQRLWYCEEHFVPLPEPLPTLDDLKAAVERKERKRLEKPRKRGPLVGYRPQTVIVDDPIQEKPKRRKI
jgi:hypothetical protein